MASSPGALEHTLPILEGPGPTFSSLDDVGLGPVRQREDEPTAAHTLFNPVDRRHGKLSTAVTSNIDLRQ